MKVKGKPRSFLQRSRLDIIACILENCNERSRKTRIIYACNLSLLQFNRYRDCLIEARLLEVSKRENGIEFLDVTQKGKEFLRDYKKIKRILDKSLK